MSAFQLENLDGIICTDLPGGFLFISSRENNYIFTTHTQAKYHQQHRAKTHQNFRGTGTQERALVSVHRRSPPEESAGRTTGNKTLLGGEGRLNDTDREEAKEKERKTGKLQGKSNPGESGRGGEGGEGGPEPPSDVKRSTLNYKEQSLEISQAAVRGVEHHHPIIDKLGDLGGRTYRQTDILHLHHVLL